MLKTTKVRQDYIQGVPSTMSGTSYNLCEIKSMYYLCKDISCRGTTTVNVPVDLRKIQVSHNNNIFVTIYNYISLRREKINKLNQLDDCTIRVQ